MITLISKEKTHFQISTRSNPSDRVAQLAEHWASIPKVVGSIPTVVRHSFSFSGVEINSASHYLYLHAYSDSNAS